MAKQTVTTRVKSTKLTDQHPWLEILFRCLEIWTFSMLWKPSTWCGFFMIFSRDIIYIYIICIHMFYMYIAYTCSICIYIYISTWANIRPDLICVCLQTVGISPKLLYYYIENDDWPIYRVYQRILVHTIFWYIHWAWASEYRQCPK